MSANLMNLINDLVEEITNDLVDSRVRLKSGLDYDAALAATQKPDTDAGTLSKIFSDYGSHVAIAQAIAVHPNASSHSLQTLFMFMPDEVRKNPAFESVSSEDQWQRNIRYLQRTKLKGKSNSFGIYAVTPTNPSLYKAAYYLEHGAPEDFRYVAFLEAIPNELLRPFLIGKNSNKRKILASRTNLDSEDFEVLANDSAKTVRLALASNPSLPPSIVEKLLKDNDEAVRSAAADNPACPPELAHTAKTAEAAKPTLADKDVCKLKDDEIKALLRNPATPADRLDELAKSAEPTVRYACGLHPNASPALCEALLNNDPEWLAEAVAWNPNAPVELLEQLAQKGTDGILMGLAHNPATPESVQLDIAESGNDDQRYGLANATEHESVWARLAEKGDTTKAIKDQGWVDHLAIALHPKSKASQLRGMQRRWEGRHTFVGRLTARHPNCPPSLVSQYAYYCFAELAHNPKFALQILEDPDAIRGEPIQPWKLSEWVSSNGVPGHVANFYLQSDDEKNRRRAAAARRASVSLLQPMALDPDTKLRSALAARSDLTRFMFEQLGQDKNNKTREIVAKNKYCPAEVLALLATDKTAAVRAGATQNRNYRATGKGKGGAATVEPLHDRGPLKDRIKMATEARKAAILADLSQDKDADVREAVAENERTKADVLTLLANDPEPRVRRRIPYQEATPEKVRHALLDDEDVDVRYAAFNSSMHWADHKKRPKELKSLIDRAMKEPEAKIRAIAAGLAKDVETQEKLANEDEECIRRNLSRNRNLAVPVAKHLLECGDDSVRAKVIEDIADIDTVRKVLGDPNDKAFQNAIYNPLVLEHAEEFVEHPHEDVRSHLAYYIDKLPDSSFDKLIRHSHGRTQQYLAKAKKMPRDRIDKLLDIAHPDAIWELSTRGKLNKDDILRCANHADSAVREVVASSHPISDDVFDRFLKDSDDVRNGLSYNTELTKAQKARLKQVDQQA